MPKAKKLILIDANSLANRAFYALPPFTNSEGLPTNAVYGFLAMLFRLLDEERPEYLAVAFDFPAPTLRHQAYEAYKAHRPRMPDELRPQLPLLREVLAALNIAVFEQEGYEADDLLGTLAARAEEAGLTTLIVTGDRDALQLVSEQVTTLITRRGISDMTRFDPAAVAATYGIEPRQVIDLKALMGDASDNIPGVPGVGEKTALKLVQQYGSVEAVLEHAHEVAGKKLQERLIAHKDDALLSKQLATIDRAMPLAVDWEACRRRAPDHARAADLFRRLEFKTLLEKIAPADQSQPPAPAAASLAVAVEAIGDSTAVQQRLAAALAAAPPGKVAVLAPTQGGCLQGAAIAWAERPAEAGAGDAQQVIWVQPDAGAGLDDLWPAAGRWISHGVKPALVWALCRGRGIAAPRFDTELAAYLLEPARSAYELADLCRSHGIGDLPLDAVDPARYWGARAATLAALAAALAAELATAGLTELYTDVELPLLPILAAMEVRGVGIDRAQLDRMADQLAERIAELTGQIHGLAGLAFNINSPRQLGEVLFAKLGLPVIRRSPKTKEPSTDAAVLEELAPQHEVVQKILDYRTLVKLKGTYVDGLRELIRDGRIHTTFNQTVTATGRLSSTEPNLQNIPIRLEEGRRIRKAFVPTQPGWVLLAADYSQIELRIVAHYSGDASLREAFLQNQDIHTRTAAEVHGISMDAVTPEMRRQAKAVNFGLIYGQSDFGLARQTGLSRAEARAFIERYFQLYPGVKRYMEEKVAEARRTGFVTTLLGRRRFLPDIGHRAMPNRQRAEREAINTPIQGTAADLIKLAMVRVHRDLPKSGLQAAMILQVHDELVFECTPDAARPLATLVRRAMEGALELSVPLQVDVKAGPNWYDMQPVSSD